MNAHVARIPRPRVEPIVSRSRPVRSRGCATARARAIVAGRMRPLTGSRSTIIGLVIVVVAMGAIGFVPLFDGPGYESALGAGILLAFAASITAALDGSALSPPPRPIDALSRGLAIGGGLAIAAYLTTLAHGLRVGFCDALAGSIHFALGPIAGALLAGTWGALAGEVARRTRRRRLVAVLLGAAAPVVSIGISIGRFLTSPMIFAYDPFVGHFSGSLYDTVIDSSGLVTYRAGSAATLFAAAALALHLGRDERGRLVRSSPRSALITITGALALLGSVMVTVLGPRLGHWQTSATITEALGARLSGARCEVIYPRTLRRADVERFAADCDAHVARAERWFGAAGPPRITAFVFESAAQKGALMGAADTYIAKPWRREVYVQAAAYPHPVIGHELVHVITGAFARGPFSVAGTLRGILPNPGLIEGVAVAAAPDAGELTAREWAKAMKDQKLLPALDRLFALSFLTQNSSTAYTVSGAFVGWVHERFGGAAIRAWYGGGALPEITGASWAELERAWHEDLDRVTLPETARAAAKARFDRPAIFGRRCPHVIDACRARADRLRGAGDTAGAIEAYQEAQRLDPRDEGLRYAIATARLHGGEVEEGRRAIEAIAERHEAPRHLRDRALEELADLALGAGRGEEAARRYRERASRVLDQDHLRTLDVKIEAATDPRLRPAVVALLVGTIDRGPDRSLSMELLGALTAIAPEDGTAFYLLGRQYLNASQYEDAAARLDRALLGTIRAPRVRIEAERLRLVAACALGDREGAARLLAMYAAHPEVSVARRMAARALVDRCAAAPAAGYDGAAAKEPR